MFFETTKSLFYQLCKRRFMPLEMMVNFAQGTTLK